MIKQVIMDVSSDNLRNYHMELTKAPHIAGLKRDQELTSWIKNVNFKTIRMTIFKAIVFEILRENRRISRKTQALFRLYFN